jgi:hypothetical protein
MATNRKPRGASPRAKPGTARAASQARSVPDATDQPLDLVVATEESEPSPSIEVSVSEEILEAEVVSPVPVEAVAETVLVSEPIVVAESTESKVPESMVYDGPSVIEAESLPSVEAVVPVPESMVHDRPSVIESSEEIAKATPRSKSKVSSPKSVQSPKGDKTMTEATETSAPLAAAKKETAIATTGSALPVRPVMPTDLEVVGRIYSAGERPIAAATVAVFGTYLNGRPIEASSLKLFEILPGDRPIFANDVSYLDGLVGGRPIMVSPAGLLGAEEVMGSRPIFTNDIVDPEPATLMGYLD